jgi:translation initiation factor IF-2
VVAINKIDAPGANVDRVLRQMQDRELAPEAWGGETLSAEVSALKGEGLEDLLDSLLLQAEVTEGIEADPRGEPHGVILEAQKELGRGSTASVIVQSGTLKPGMALVCGEHYCRIRQIMDDKGKQVKEAEPSKPVKVIGWSGPPDAGDVFKVVKNERTAKKEAEDNAEQRRKIRDADSGESAPSLEGLFAAIEKTQKKTFRVLVKADVYGTAEALATSLLAIHSEKIDLEVVDMGVGDVTRNDITMASAANAAVVGFNIGLENGVNSMAKHESVQLIQHNIIYELINQVKDSMADLLEPELRENKIGAAEIRALFPLGKGTVAGCMVTEGRINRDAPARLVRNGEIVAEARISTLKRFKDDATEVRAGYECGVQLEGVNDYREKDSIEVYEILKIKPDL